MNRHSLLLALGLTLTACGTTAEVEDPAPSPPPLPPPAVVPCTPRADPPLPAGLYRLKTNAAATETDDFAPLVPMLAKASLVGLGESVHTTGGQYAAKARLFRFLVEKLGFRVFAIESPHTKADILARHLDTCTGTARDALRGVFPVFADDNLESLVDWMCVWNRSHPNDKLRAFGFDAQQGPTDAKDLATLLDRFAGAGAPTLKAGFATCTSLGDPTNLGDRPYAGGAAAFEACGKGLDSAREWLDQNSTVIVDQSSRETFELGKLALVGLRSWEAEVYYSSTDYEKSSNPRDEAMAYTFETLRALRFPEAKVALWAHNIHLMARHSKATASYYDEPYKTMGEHLAEREGDNYAVVGVVSYRAEINWPNVPATPPLPTEPNALERILHGFGEDGLVVDVAAYPASKGAFVVNGESMIPSDQFRALLYVDHSPPMKALFW